MTVKYIKEPGFVYDLITMISLSLNKETALSELKKKKDNNNEDISFFENIINQCGKPPEDILPFFYTDKNSLNFISTYYVIKNNNISKLNINNLILELSDKELLKNNLNEFYFGTLNKYNDDYIELIDKSNLNLILKYRLTRVFANINRASEMVIAEIIRLIPILEDIYNGFKDIIYDKLNMLSDTKTLEKIYLFNNLIKNNNSETIISICIISRYTCFTFFNETEFFILGDDFIDSIDKQTVDKRIDVDIMALGKIISDPTRLKMLELLKEKKEIYTSEMCDILEMTLTAVFYHLNIMLTEKLLKTRNEGRKVFYSINNNYFDVVSKMFLNIKCDVKIY
ncbi:MAG: ziaR [Clostridia bacterium]|nr:ziaR [Clostridia bacterium]